MTPRHFATLRAVVAEVYGVTERSISSRRTDRSAAYPRQMLACAARELLRWSFPRIAMEMSRDHTTIMYAHCQAMRRLETDELSQRRMAQITQEYARRMIMGEAA